MDDDDSYLYGDSNVEETAKPAVQTSGESLVGHWEERYAVRFVASVLCSSGAQ